MVGTGSSPLRSLVAAQTLRRDTKAVSSERRRQVRVQGWCWPSRSSLSASPRIAGNALATPGIRVLGTTVAKATFGDIFSHVHEQDPAALERGHPDAGRSDLYVQQNTWQPGGSTGWHTHPGPSFVIVTQGQRDRLRGRRHELHAARLHGRHAQQLVRRHRWRRRAPDPQRDRRCRADRGGPASSRPARRDGRTRRIRVTAPSERCPCRPRAVARRPWRSPRSLSLRIPGGVSSPFRRC